MSDDSNRGFQNVYGDPIGSIRRQSRRSILKSIGVSAGIAGTGVLSSATPTRAASSRAPPQPGPEVLYDSPASAPQLENGEGWDADPLLVSGTTAYVDGEFLYQDFVYDDYGANTTNLPLPPNPEPGGEIQSELLPSGIADGLPELESVGDLIGMAYGAPTGDMVYPSDGSTHRDNAADLLEFRARPTHEEGKITYRITFNTMTEAGVAGAAIGIDTGSFDSDTDSPGDESENNTLLLDAVGDVTDITERIGLDTNGSAGSEWGYGLGSLGVDPDHVLVTWGNGAELDGSSEGVDVSISERRNQIDVTVPLAPGEETWRHYLVVGLFDEDKTEFTQVQKTPDETHPGGAHLTNPPPVFNVGFRSNEQEPMGAPNIEPGDLSEELEDTISNIGSRGLGFGHWREHAQAMALAARDISPFFADIDFGKLRTGATERHVPETGYINRLYASRHDFEDADVDFTPGEGIDGSANTITGRIQPYAVYIPESYSSDKPTPFLLNLHSLASSYNEYAVLMPDLLEQLGEQRDSIVLMPEGRGGEGWWRNEAELDVFEAWADAAARYNIDFDRAFITGYSMGGYGTYKLASQYPDLFVKGFSVVGPPDEKAVAGTLGEEFGTIHNVKRITDNLRNIPIRLWNGANDELVPVTGVIRYEQQLRDHGYRHELDVFPGYDHFAFALLDEWGPAREFLGNDTGNATPTITTTTHVPPQVTYRAVSAMDNETLGLVHDGAYWVSDIDVADGTDSGLVDVRSLAFDKAPPGDDDYRGFGNEPTPHTKRGTRWKKRAIGPSPKNALDITLETVESVTIWVEEAAIDPEKPITLSVESNTAATITLAAADDSVELHVPSGSSERVVKVD